MGTWLKIVGVVVILYLIIFLIFPGDHQRALIWSLSITLGYQIGNINELKKELEEGNGS